MWLLVAVLSLTVVAAGSTSCEDARMRCVYRTGCGAAINNYMYLCNEVLSKPTTVCPKACEHALIALTSTEEGKELMNCQCEDQYCLDAKKRIDVCRPQVLRGAANATSSCRLSQLICLADAQCATALDYYNQLCRSVYRGRKCSNKCLNSIEILRKQEKAAALTVCRCDGNEDYDCPRMQNNLARLCFHKHLKNHTKNHERGYGEKHKKHHHQELPSATNSITVTSLLFLLCTFVSSNYNT
ncbi:growth arrest-specific protein 1-like [Vanessa tameamea]|uniref:Growth arrest-specific protein 1-like n=1 Tax=Vanessa tameamea TaxID=334116 RepID=A0A8B8I259_VANTA|nr:growth arrest-specific protein 1-like [Vanessa tameamea]